MSITSDRVPSDRVTVAEAIAAWEAKGPTSLTVALLADALYGARDTIARAEALAEEWDAMADAHEDEQPTAARVQRFDARDLRAALRGPEPTERPYLCRHGHYATEHWCDDHADHTLPAGPPLHELADRDGDNVPSDRVRAYAEAIDNAVLPARQRAVMAVADREQAALRAEVERLRAREAALIRAKDADLDDVRDELDLARATVTRVQALRDRVKAGGADLGMSEQIDAALRGPQPTEEPS